MGKRIFPSSKKQSLSGAAAEQLALTFLQSKGLVLVTKNFRTRRGEIDLIMLDNTVMVFVEVRFRSSVCFWFSRRVYYGAKMSALERRRTGLYAA
jgi:putative endonuclease